MSAAATGRGTSGLGSARLPRATPPARCRPGPPRWTPARSRWTRRPTRTSGVALAALAPPPGLPSPSIDEALRLCARTSTRTATHADATLAALVDGSAKCGLVSSMLVRVYDRASALGAPAGWATPSRARARERRSRSPAARPTCRRATPARRPRCGAPSYAVASPRTLASPTLAYAGDFERLASTRTEDAVLSAGLARTLRYGGDITVEVWPEQRDAAEAAAALTACPSKRSSACRSTRSRRLSTRRVGARARQMTSSRGWA